MFMVGNTMLPISKRLICFFSSGLPYDVTAADALKQKDVQDRIQHSMNSLKEATDRFLTVIFESTDKLPYVKRYII